MLGRREARGAKCRPRREDCARRSAAVRVAGGSVCVRGIDQRPRERPESTRDVPGSIWRGSRHRSGRVGRRYVLCRVETRRARAPSHGLCTSECACVSRVPCKQAAWTARPHWAGVRSYAQPLECLGRRSVGSRASPRLSDEEQAAGEAASASENHGRLLGLFATKLCSGPLGYWRDKSQMRTVGLGRRSHLLGGGRASCAGRPTQRREVVIECRACVWRTSPPRSASLLPVRCATLFWRVQPARSCTSRASRGWDVTDAHLEAFDGCPVADLPSTSGIG